VPGLWVTPVKKSLSVAGCTCGVAWGLMMNMLNYVGAFLVQVTNGRFVTWAEAKKAIADTWAAK
jgi:hypothetical protein